MYNSFEFPDFENIRFHVILDQVIPDLSFFKHVCPGDCEGCLESFAEVYCRMCCQDQMKEPMSISFLTDHFDYITDWLTSSEVFRGLKAIYNNVIGRNMRNAEPDVFNPQEINTFIRNFHWHRSNSLDPNPEMPVDFETDLNRSSFDPPEICGYYEQGASRADQGRIVGGEEVKKLSMFPWQMSLSTGFLGLYYQHRCGAALINDRWALTAAHCTRQVSSETNLYIIGGFLDINNKEAAQIRYVEKIINHENFMPTLYENDISLLRTEEPITYTPSLIPICLPDPEIVDAPGYARFNVGKNATLTGWGRLWNDGPLAEQLEMVTLPLISNLECMRWYNASGSRQFIPTQTFLCAGYKKGEMDACSGDSGGPLIISREDGRMMLWGIVSWGIGCGVAGRPGVYTRVSQFTKWIESNVKENSPWLNRK